MAKNTINLMLEDSRDGLEILGDEIDKLVDGSISRAEDAPLPDITIIQVFYDAIRLPLNTLDEARVFGDEHDILVESDRDGFLTVLKPPVEIMEIETMIEHDQGIWIVGVSISGHTTNATTFDSDEDVIDFVSQEVENYYRERVDIDWQKVYNDIIK
jgi:hypothetical protein